MAASAYYMTSKEVKNQILRHNSILSQPTLTKWWNCICVQILYSYFRYTQKQSSRGVLCILRNFTKSTGKHLCQSLFFNIKKSLWRRCFSVNFVKFLRTPFFWQNTSGGCFYTLVGFFSFLLLAVSGHHVQ